MLLTQEEMFFRANLTYKEHLRAFMNENFRFRHRPRLVM